MDHNNIENFAELIRSQFSEKTQQTIDYDTNLKLTNEWSSLQTMIIVNEIDKEYGVLLDSQDLKCACSINSLFSILQAKKN